MDDRLVASMVAMMAYKKAPSMVDMLDGQMAA